LPSDWIDVREAWRRIESLAPVLRSTACPLAEANGRVLAESVVADRDLPPFHRSAMDGYAVRSAEIAAATREHPVALHVAGEVKPGQPGDAPLRAGTALRIMTGAAVPDGWDAVVPVEDTSGFDSDPVQVYCGIAPLRNIAPRGSERRAGDQVFEVGHLLTPVDIGALAMLGCTAPRVFHRPSVSLLATGDELVDPDDRPGDYTIRNSNTPMLEALLHDVAGPVHLLGVAPDERAALRGLLEQGMQRDVLIITGGVSAGAYDHVEDLLETLGVRIVFRQVALQPGKPATFGVHPSGCVLALPGNPVSAWTTFRLFGGPLLLRMQGARAILPQFERRIADFAWKRRNPKWILFPVEAEGERLRRAPYAGSGDLLAFSRAHGQVVLPPETSVVAPGDPVWFWPGR
jgi:molybdopterin molybdotransferase